MTGTSSRQTTDTKALITQAETATKARDWVAAVSLWRQILQRQGNKATSRTYIRLSQANRNLKRIEEAESVLATGMQHLCQNIDRAIACEAASIEMAKGNYTEALARWQVVFDLFEPSVPAIAYIGKSTSHRHLGEYAAAEKIIRVGLAKYPDDERLLREQDAVLLDGGLRPSNPYHDFRIPQNQENWQRWRKRSKAEAERRWRQGRQQLFARSGEAARIQELRGAYFGKRCFILGNGPSLRKQDLSLLRGEYTFVTNWFVNAENYEDIAPTFYCVSSHEMFGGWNKPEPAINDDFYQRMLERTAGSIKFFSFAFRDYVKGNGLFPGHDVRYLLFERPKNLVDEIGSINLDVNKHLDDAYTVVLTMCVPLAVHMGFSEIVLLGCDCDYGIETASDPKKYFYDSRLHTTSTSKFESLQRIWADDGPVFKAYEIVARELESRGIRFQNATAGGRLDVVPRVSYEDLFSVKRSRSSVASPRKTAFCSVVNDAFVQGFSVLLHSILKCHPGFDYPYYVLHSRNHVPLSAENQAYLRRIYSGLVFKEVDESAYEGIWGQLDALRTPERLKPAFLIFDAFSLTDFDRVVTLDGDMICLGDISELTSARSDLAFTQAWDYASGRLADYFNSGLIVIGGAHLNGRTYERLLRHKVRPTFDTRVGKADQAILNDLFSISSVDLLPERFNTTKRKFPDDAISSYESVLSEGVRILHYVGEKPWQEHTVPQEARYTKVEQLWLDLHAELMRKHEPSRHAAAVEQSDGR